MQFDKKTLEKYSSAISLSDMEIFVFPELMYSLVLANIMSPILWRWRKEETFKKLENKSPYKKFMRAKQYIMDNYEFNLDLETWGLTTSDAELKRFEDIISPEDIAGSNALFGYTGDKYYFDVDIRRHFGLDKYNSNIIPYWKTETIEAMDAFKYRQGYDKGGGECVSLAALYAAVCFVVCRIRLEDIFMILTPLHSQNYININGGIITNNRRIVTKKMWFNGTAISDKAQRAIRNEKVTIVAHNTGYIHTFYDEATIDLKYYEKFTDDLKNFLTAELNLLNLVNFLRCHHDYQKYFQFCRHFHNTAKFVNAETMFLYEHSSNFRIADDTYDKLLAEIEEDDYSPYKDIKRVCCEELRRFINKKNIDLSSGSSREELAKYLNLYIPDSADFVEKLKDFLIITPKLPSINKSFNTTEPIKMSIDMERDDVIEYLKSIRQQNITADLAFYACRDTDNCCWEPFVKASMERNPVSIQVCKDKALTEIYSWLRDMENFSIYSDNRLACPDEVVNFTRGDGIEKAFTLANIIKARHPDRELLLSIDRDCVMLQADTNYSFLSNKTIVKDLKL